MSETVHDRVAEKLEAAGLWRRAATRWLAVMGRPGNTAVQLEWLRQRRVYCRRQITSPAPPEKGSITSVSQAATRALDKMGLARSPKVAFRTLNPPKDKP
ncbi:TPA: PerC family transcriptional regulator [Enterobacter hormaechei subsp. steigerwaltii]|nr:PerC family transcriptional regulator [Enterobacter hormaechei subsp. steigerwaltii]